jgi:hypothetical protein
MKLRHLAAFVVILTAGVIETLPGTAQQQQPLLAPTRDSGQTVTPRSRAAR